MLDITTCDSCTHTKVCGKKDKYMKYFDELGQLCVSPRDKTIIYAKDDADIWVDLKCKHYEKHYPTYVK